MVETEVTVIITRKSDLQTIEQLIIERKIQFPVYIREFELNYQVSFTSDYEEWELDTAILHSFPGYEFTTELGKGQKEIRLQVSRYQSEFSTDGWGRPIENPLNETKYLQKKAVNKLEKFNPKVKVLFENQEQYYFVNIVGGINKTTEEKGFLLLDSFKANVNIDEAGVLKDKLYMSPLEAFYAGCYRMSDIVERDFKLYIEEKKKAIKNTEKQPRKIIRDFIHACNRFDEANLYKNLDDKVVYERRLNWKTVLITKGIDAFKQFIQSQDQHLCKSDLKIRSSWTVNLPSVTIGVKYPADNAAKTLFEKYGQFTFIIKDHKIVNIIDAS